MIEQHQKIVSEAMKAAPVIPVLVIDDSALATDLAKALIGGGLPILEVTLRTPQALAAMEKMAGVNSAVIAAGTCKRSDDLKAAKEAGAQIAVSPGATQALIQASQDLDMPLLPGSESVSTSMELFDSGFTHQKFFPAEAAGGAVKLKAIAQPLPEIRYCPTGGITPQSAAGYLDLPNVICVGGSWIAPADLVANRDWAAIEKRAQTAAMLKRG